MHPLSPPATTFRVESPSRNVRLSFTVVGRHSHKGRRVAVGSRARVPDRPVQGGPYRVQVLDRMLSMLDVLAQSDSDLGPTELGERLSLHRSTTHRLLKVLERHQLIRKSQVEGKYALGIKLFELGNRVVSQFDLAPRSQPFLRRLVDLAGETAHVCVLNDAEMVSVANVEGPWTLRTPSTVGRRTPLYCTSVGKVLLAYLPTAEQSLLLDRVKFLASHQANDHDSRCARNRTEADSPARVWHRQRRNRGRTQVYRCAHIQSPRGHRCGHFRRRTRVSRDQTASAGNRPGGQGGRTRPLA